ncbi:retinaldehyde-binding protein 1-like [Schistocerca cancellata]|uniref:retinaldehyde-binding protein 1-like n=1 Tax=Schistocerca cancellata TaxID=274614 RepID=UPI0021181336|nr:retinaldehyde-binding protein 1-like [Schistocerca cancellata]
MPSSWESLDEHWKQRAQYELKEDPTKIEANICALRALVQGEKGLYSRTDDTFLLTFLRARKHNVNEAFKMLENFYEMKESFPEHLEPYLPSEKSNIYDIEGMTVLEQKDDDERAVVIIRVENTDFRKVTVEECFQLITTVLLFCCEDQYVQISGITVIVDLKGFGFQHAIRGTPKTLSLFIKMFQGSFPLRLKSVHIVNHPKLFAPFFTLAKQFMKEKMRRRIHFHGTDMSSLHTHIPYEILPQQLGGMLPNFNFTSFRNKLQQHEDKIAAWRKYGYGKKPQEDTQN